MEKYNNPEWIGKKFHKMTVIDIEHGNNEWKWKCRCDCGSIRTVAPLKLLTGKTKTCGCGRVDRMKEYTKTYRTKHGGRHERLYAIWHGMKERCYTTTNKDYPKYGALGVVICEEWKDDYQVFREWAHSNGYSDDLTIDRINPYGNYEPDNCRWITIAEQAQNKRGAITVELNGETVNLAAECQRRKLPYGTVYARIFRYGKTPEEALA